MTWTPGLGRAIQGHDVFPRGEKGILLKVDKIEADSEYPEKLGLTVGYGELWIEDSHFLEKIFGILKGNTGNE